MNADARCDALRPGDAILSEQFAWRRSFFQTSARGEHLQTGREGDASLVDQVFY